MKKSLLILFTCCLLSILKTYSQACFNAVDTVGCAPFTVTMNECVADPTAVIKYEFEGKVTFDNTHTFATPGFYTVKQYVQTGIDIFTKTKVNYIRVVSNHKPSFTLSACANKTIKIQITENLYDRYIVLYPDGSQNDTLLANGSIEKSFVDLADKMIRVKGEYIATSCSNFDEKTISLINTLTPAILKSMVKTSANTIALISDLNPRNQYSIEKRTKTGSYQFLDNITNPTSNFTYTYNATDLEKEDLCFRFKTFDNCGNEVFSEEICSQNHQIIANNNEINISWYIYMGTNFNGFELYKNDVLLYTGNNLAYSDSAVICKVNYCYKLITKINLPTGASTFTSNIVCENATSSTLPVPAEKVYASIENEAVSLNWTLSEKESISFQKIERKKGNTSFSPFLNLNNSNEQISFSDSLIFSAPSCYRIQLTNKCNNNSINELALITCPSLLEYTLPTPDQITINWTNYIGFETPIYTLILKNQLNEILAEIPLSGNSYSFPIAQYLAKEFIFQIKIQDAKTGLISYSNKKSLLIKTYIYFPTGFTPNDDNLNDTFYPIGNFLAEYELKIFTQQGNLIFESPKPNVAWDGFVKGERATSGVYIYTATLKDSNNERFERQGTITLIR